MTDILDRVARAIFTAQTGITSDEQWARTNPAYLHEIARAAIAAMRDCTPEMLDAGSAAHPAGGYRRETLLNDIIECEWVAMVDAALECSTKPDEK
jgi:hypothetical protein